MRTCFNTVTANPYPLRDQIELMGKYGYEGTEIQSDKLDQYLASYSLDELKRQLEETKVKAAALMAFPFVGFSKGELENIAKYAELASKIGAETLLCFCCDGPPEGMGLQEAYARAGQSAREYGEAAAPFDVTIALEPIGANKFVPGPKQALEIAKAANRPNVGVMFDTFHCFRGRVTLDDIRAVPVERLFIVHVNDVPELPDVPFEQINDSHRVYPGQGRLPLVEEFKIIKGKGYKKFLSVEIFNRGYWQEPLENIIRESKAGLDRVLSRV